MVTTIVSTDMLRRIADGYGVHTADDLYTGFKWIGEKIDELGPDRFVFGSKRPTGTWPAITFATKTAAK